MEYKLIKFEEICDERGKLNVFQKGTNIPFELKRIFYSYQIPNEARRGLHANRKSEFVLISVVGSCKVKIDDGNSQQDFVLDKPYIGLYCGKMIWKEMYDFSEDNVLLVLSSELYDSGEYIKDYNEFIKEVKNAS